jgi:hypothetical protein
MIAANGGRARTGAAEDGGAGSGGGERIGGDSRVGRFLRVIHRPGWPFLRHAEGWRYCSVNRTNATIVACPARHSRVNSIAPRPSRSEGPAPASNRATLIRASACPDRGGSSIASNGIGGAGASGCPFLSRQKRLLHTQFAASAKTVREESLEIAIYCRPSMAYAIGELRISVPVWYFQRSFPVRASNPIR